MLCIFTNTWYFSLCNWSYSNVVVVSLVVLICFLNNQLCWESFHLLSSHLYSFFCKMYIQIFCPFKKLSCLIIIILGRLKIYIFKYLYCEYFYCCVFPSFLNGVCLKALNFEKDTFIKFLTFMIHAFYDQLITYCLKSSIYFSKKHTPKNSRGICL